MDSTKLIAIAGILCFHSIAETGAAQEALIKLAPEQPERLTLDVLTNIALQQNPSLQRLSFAIQSAQGRALQAGLYPNPTLSVTGEELGSRLGSGGVLKALFVAQEIVTAGKLQLSRAVLNRQVSQATLDLMAQRYVLLAIVRRGYFDVLMIQRRVEILNELVELSSKSMDLSQRLVDAKEIAELDLIQFRVERNRFRANRDASQRELAMVFRRLAANLGDADLTKAPLEDLFALTDPVYDFESARALVASAHPQLRASQVGVSRAQMALRRAEVEPVPNVTLGGGYLRHNKDREDDWAFQVGLPLPLFDRNQGNIRASRAEIGLASRQVTETENNLIARLASAFGEYSAAKQSVEQFRAQIIPDARKAYELSLIAFQGGEFQYLRVLQAQRTIAETNIEFVQALGEMWKGSSDISGLLLEENWPLIQAKETSANSPPLEGNKQLPRAP